MDPTPDAADEVALLRALCRDHSLRSQVTRVSDGHPDWIMESGRLRNQIADYFTIGVCEPSLGSSFLMMEQSEPALAMLLVAEVDGVESVLISIRTEPGLIGFTNVTSTIQSTPSNYLRKHGGKPTPFIDVAADPESFGMVVYDAKQYDWGGYYVHKTKRFLIVRLAEAVEAPPGYRWTAVASIGSVLLEDHLITNDLRVLLAHLLEPRAYGVGSEIDQPATDRSSLFSGAEFPLDFVDSRGTGIVFVRTETETREVGSWVQPLLDPQRPLVIRLPVDGSGSEYLFAVEKRTQLGLAGRELWFPASIATGALERRVTNSAEGGRFWRHRIDLELRRATVISASAGAGITWLTKDELAFLVAQPLHTSLELRMAWSIACVG